VALLAELDVDAELPGLAIKKMGRLQNRGRFNSRTQGKLGPANSIQPADARQSVGEEAMRRFGIIVGVVCLVLLVGTAIFVATFDVNKYRGTIQAELEKRLGRTVVLGDMGLSLFPPRFRVQNLAIADDPSFSPDAPFIKAQELKISVQLLPLLHKQFEIDALNLQRPGVNLIKNSAGVWNFASLGHPAETSTAQSGPPARQTQPANQPSPAQQPPQPPAESQFSLSKLTIEDGQISLLDQQQSKTPTLYDHIDLTLTNFAPNEPFKVDAAVHMAGAGSQEVRIQGEGGPIVRERPATTPFHGTVDLKQVGIADLSKFLNSPAFAGTDGVLTGQTKIDSDQGKLSVHGETNVLNAKIKGMDLGYPIAAQYDLTDDLPVDMITIRNMILKLGSTPLAMSGTLNAKPTPAQLALAWLMAQGNDIIPIPSNKTRKHLDENIKAAEIKLSKEELARLDAIFPAGAAAGPRSRDMHRVNI